MNNKRFPLQSLDFYSQKQSIPWEHAEEIYKEYSDQYGTQQSIERMAERGGFGSTDAIMLLCHRIKRLQGNPVR